jgi:O-antigen/teichoic acid export membrane protein
VKDEAKLESAISVARPVISRILLSASATVILQGASMVMGFATAVLLARLLGGQRYGWYVFALSWAGILTIPALLGLDRFLVRGIAIYEVQRKWQLMGGLLRRTNQLVLLSSMVIACTGCVVAIVWLSPSLRWPFCVAMLLVPTTALTLLRQGAMQAIGRVVTGQSPEYLIRPILILVGIGALELVGALTPTTALEANVTGVAVAFVVGTWLLRRALPAAVRSVRPEYATSEWIRAALPMMLVGGVWIANSYITTLVVGTLDGPRAAGVYSVVQKGAELIVVLLVAANMPLAPAIARMHAHGDKEGFEHTTHRVAQTTLLVSAPVAAALFLFPGIYLGLFGPGFQTGATALRILALGQLFNAAAGPAGNVLIMAGHERAAVWGMGVGLLANLALGVALVPLLGVAGGAIAFAASLVLWNTLLVVLVRQRIGVNVTAFRRLAVTRPKQTG